jgi:hypothetical protein
MNQVLMRKKKIQPSSAVAQLGQVQILPHVTGAAPPLISPVHPPPRRRQTISTTLHTNPANLLKVCSPSIKKFLKVIAQEEGVEALPQLGLENKVFIGIFCVVK